jgi:hypothetical protein
MLEVIVAGETDAVHLADLARGLPRAKRDRLEQALAGWVRPNHCFLIAEQLSHVDYLDEAIERMSAEIALRLRAYEEAIARLDTIFRHACVLRRSGASTWQRP